MPGESAVVSVRDLLHEAAMTNRDSAQERELRNLSRVRPFKP